MTDFNFQDSLLKILGEIGKKDWATPLTELSQKFQCISPDEYSFEHELLNMLHGIHATTSIDNSLPPSLIAAIRLSALDCWTFRFIKVGAAGRHRYLNPLVDPASEFLTPGIQHDVASSANPPVDIIKRWARENLR